MPGHVKYTLVQHSAFGYKGDPTFERAVETRAVPLKREQARVSRVGGVTGTYAEMEDLAERVNYPEGTEGLVPQARGTFSELAVDGLSIYVPVREVAG